MTTPSAHLSEKTSEHLSEQHSDRTLDIVTYNQNSLNNLRRSVVLGQGQFSLILARANYQQLRQVLLKR